LQEELSEMSEKSLRNHKGNKSKSFLDQLKISPKTKVRVRRKSQQSPTELKLQKKHIILAKKVVTNLKTVRPLPGSLEYEIEKGDTYFLRADSKQFKEKESTNSNSKPAPLKVLKDKDGFYIRRTFIGTPEEFQKAERFHNTLQKYNFSRSHMSKKGGLQKVHTFNCLMKSGGCESGNESTPKSMMSRLRSPNELMTSRLKDVSTTNIASLARKSIVSLKRRPLTKQDMMMSMNRFKI
jgi:hypothetical protein